MASVQYKKLHLPQDVKRMLFHCDKDTRLKTNHANIDIDKTVTHKNTQGNIDYEAACKRYDERIAELDAMPAGKRNRRKDRVSCFGLYIPTPKDLKPEDEEEFFGEVLKIIAAQYGGFTNVVQYFIHRDEKHRFLNSQTGKISVSRTHMHVYVIPLDRKGKLNGKWFSNRSNMIKLNNAIHKMAQEKFGVMFMDGSKRKSRKTVEQLKNESVFREAQKDLETQKAGLDVRQDAVREQEAALDIKAEELQTKQQILFETQITLDKKEDNLKAREDDVKAQEDDSSAALQRAVELRDTALQVLQRLQEMEEEDRQLIELGKRQLRRQRTARLADDAAVKAYFELNGKINDLTLQK